LVSSTFPVSEELEGDGEIATRANSALQLSSKGKDSSYRSGRSSDGLKMKNDDVLAVKREADEDWGKERWR
jgi:hypothetical protein